MSVLGLGQPDELRPESVLLKRVVGSPAAWRRDLTIPFEQDEERHLTRRLFERTVKEGETQQSHHLIPALVASLRFEDSRGRKAIGGNK